MFFWKAVGTSFLRIWVPFGLHFGRLRGKKSEKQGSGEVSKNSFKKGAAGTIKSHAGFCPPGGGGSLKHSSFHRFTMTRTP